MQLKEIIKSILTNEDTQDLTIDDLKEQINNYLDEENISEEEVLVRSSKYETLYLNDYNSLISAIWECIQSNLVN